MEFEDVREQINWECKRVAAAFGVTEWKLRGEGNLQSGIYACFSGLGPDEQYVHWLVGCNSGHDPQLLKLTVQSEDAFCRISARDSGDDSTHWLDWGAVGQHLMARGLYRLGFEDEGILCQLPQLSEHEKMEFRLSMPREFWPKKWLDEEGV